MNQEARVNEGTVRMLLASSQVVRSQQGYALLGARCNGCSTIAFPVLSSCPRCGGTERRSSTVPSRGRLYVHTRVHIARPGIKVPYVVGYVDIDDDMRLFGSIDAEFDTLRPGQELELVVGATKKKRGTFEYFFRPVEAA